jgi:hypothetical protein
MDDAAEALRQALGVVRSHIPEDELRRVVKRWTLPTRVVATVREVDASAGSLCSTRAGVCLIPGASLPLGERIFAEILPAPAGCAWTFWAETYERAEAGWSLEGCSSSDSKWRQKSNQSSTSTVHTNERHHRERVRRADPRGAQGR